MTPKKSKKFLQELSELCKKYDIWVDSTELLFLQDFDSGSRDILLETENGLPTEYKLRKE